METSQKEGFSLPLSALEILTKAVTEVEQTIREEEAKKAIEEVSKRYEETRKRHEEASEKLLEIKRRRTQAIEQKETDLKAIEDLVARAQRIREKLAPTIDVPSLVITAREQAERRIAEADKVLPHADEEARKAKAAYEEAAHRFREVQEKYRGRLHPQFAAHAAYASQAAHPAPPAVGAAQASGAGPMAGALEILIDRIDGLAAEIDNAREYIKTLSKDEQLAQLCIWAGKARKIQDGMALNTEEIRHVRWVFGRLTTLSKDLWCGVVEGLNRSYVTDWDRYVSDAQHRLAIAAAQSGRAHRERDAKTSELRTVDALARRREAREAANRAFPELRAIARHAPPLASDQAEALRRHLKEVLRAIPPDDDELIGVIRPHASLLENWPDGRPILDVLANGGKR
ncbi:MAG: hypothetical protein AAB215_03455 [Planctomycetota bacterium]